MREEWERLFNLCYNPVPDGVTVGAIIMPTGDWLDRAGPALKLFHERFNQRERPPYLVVTGANSHPDLRGGGASAPKVVRTMKIFGNLTPEMEERIIVEANAEYTNSQAEEVYKLLQAGRIVEPLEVVVSDYHLPRLISTFLVPVLRNEGENLRTRIYSVSVPYDESRKVHEPGPTKKADRIFAEMERIHRYREKGDVATEQAVREYARWLRSQ